MTDALPDGWIGRLAADAMAEFTAAVTQVGASFAEASRKMDAAVRTLWVIAWRHRRAEYDAFGRTRPDGRPRRSGHRHRGTPAWTRRNG